VGDIHVLVRSLRGFERGDVLLKAVREELRKPVPVIRARIKATAVSNLPHRGGLGAWVAASKVTAAVTLERKAVTIRLRGGRRSTGAQSDIRAIDRGRVRAPEWGRRGRGQWHSQTVEPGFFTKTASEAPEWSPAIDRAIVAATGQIHA